MTNHPQMHVTSAGIPFGGEGEADSCVSEDETHRYLWVIHPHT